MNPESEPPDMTAELQIRLDELEAEFREDFELDKDPLPNPGFPDSNRARFENSIAKVLLRDVDALIASDQLLQWREKLGGNFPIGELARFLGERRLVKPQLRLDLARRDLRKLDVKAHRSLDLLAILIEKPPSLTVAAYLQRVANCYIEGLDPECVVMCRAVLDSAFENTINDTQVIRTLPASRIKGRVQLAHRIETAERIKIIDRATARLARIIKDAGNDAIHNIPVVALTPLEAVEGTVKILEALL